MAFFVSAQNPYPTAIGLRVIGERRSDPMFNMAYEDGQKLDFRARKENAVQMLVGFRVREETAPAKLLWESASKPVPDVMVHVSVLIVSDEFRSVVESLEPGLHQFISVDIVDSRRRPIDRPYYWLNVCQRLDTISEEKSNVIRKPGREGSFYWNEHEVSSPHLVFDSKKINGHHLWVEEGRLSSRYCHCSDELGRRLLNKSLLGLQLTALEEV